MEVIILVLWKNSLNLLDFNCTPASFNYFVPTIFFELNFSRHVTKHEAIFFQLYHTHEPANSICLGPDELQ